MIFPKKISIRRPDKKPMYMPSFLPLMKPNAEVMISSIFGTIPASVIDLNNVVCRRYPIIIMIATTILLNSISIKILLKVRYNKYGVEPFKVNSRRDVA